MREQKEALIRFPAPDVQSNVDFLNAMRHDGKYSRYATAAEKLLDADARRTDQIWLNQVKTMQETIA